MRPTAARWMQSPQQLRGRKGGNDERRVRDVGEAAQTVGQTEEEKPARASETAHVEASRRPCGLRSFGRFESDTCRPERTCITRARGQN